MKHKHKYTQNSSIIGKDNGYIELVCSKDGKGLYCGKHLRIFWGDTWGDIQINNPYKMYKEIIGYENDHGITTV